MRIVSAGLAATLAVTGASSAWGFVTPPVRSGTYYEQNGEQSCPSAYEPFPHGTSSGTSGTTSGPGPGDDLCAIAFDAIPAGKQLLVDRVSCALVSESHLFNVYLAVRDYDYYHRPHMLAPIVQNNAAPWFYRINDEMSGYLVESQDSPRVVMDASVDPSRQAMKCQIVGRLVDIP